MQWFLNLPRAARYSILAPIIIGLFGLAIWLGVRDRHNEPVWDDGPERGWRAPIKVHADQYGTATKAAVGMWRKAAGCELFVVVASPEDADVTIKPADGETCGSLSHESEWEDDAASAFLCGERAEIHISKPGDIRMQTIIVAHELGHVLGLAHDPDPCTSLMHGNGSAIYQCSAVLISRKDEKAVGDRYCGR